MGVGHPIARRGPVTLGGGLWPPPGGPPGPRPGGSSKPAQGRCVCRATASSCPTCAFGHLHRSAGVCDARRGSVTPARGAAGSQTRQEQQTGARLVRL